MSWLPTKIMTSKCLFPITPFLQQGFKEGWTLASNNSINLGQYTVRELTWLKKSVFVMPSPGYSFTL